MNIGENLCGFVNQDFACKSGAVDPVNVDTLN